MPHIFGFDRMGAKSRRTIGILGCAPGAGATHLALALCSYCASKSRQKTALLEMHSRNELIHLSPESVLPAKNAPECTSFCFTLHGIDCYPCVNSVEIPALLNSGYSCLILDMGNLAEADHAEFLRCDRKVVLGSLAPWKIQSYNHFFENFSSSVNLGEGFYYLVQTGSTKEILSFSGSHHVLMHRVPFIQNPLSIKKELFPFLEQLLAEH